MSFLKKSAFHRSDRKTQKRNPKRTTESKPVWLFAKLGIYNQNTAKLRSEYFLFESKGAWYSIGVKVPSTSSLSVYTKVLAHNLNDIRNWASLIGLLLRICWCLLSVFLIYCSDEWKKLVNLIYCFQVLFRMNFKIMYFLMKILGNTPPQTVQHLGIPFLLKMQHEVLFFFLLILLMTHWIQGLNVWETP